MQIPSDSMIEMALGRLKDPVVLADEIYVEAQKHELQELNELGEARVQKLGASGLSKDFQIGYLLGLETARVVLAGIPELVFKDIKASELL